MGLGSKLLRRWTRARHLRDLNTANMFRQTQQAHLSPQAAQALRLRRENAQLRQQWHASAKRLNLHDSAPDSDAGQAFLATLTGADIHALACALHYDGRYDDAWALGFVGHPACDLGTAWAVFLGTGAPMQIERYLWENDGKTGPFAEEVRRNDLIVRRMAEDGFATRDFAPQDIGRIAEYGAAMQAARAQGLSLRWDIPKAAFQGLKGAPVRARVEKIGDDVLDSFDSWLARSPQG